MEDDEFTKLCSTSPEQLQRKRFLEPLAEKLNINHKRYKNRGALCKALIDKYYESQCDLEHIENETDFATLENIKSIDKTRLVMWKQDNKTYACDIESMKNWLDSGHYLSPYAIDVASGVAMQNDPDEYSKRFDLRNIQGFVEFINTRWKDLGIEKSEDADGPSDIYKMRFEIERYGDYITPLIDRFETLGPRVALRYTISALEALKSEYINTSFSHDIQESFMQDVFIFEQLTVGLMTMGIKHPFNYLLYVCESMSQLFDQVMIEKYFECVSHYLRI